MHKQFNKKIEENKYSNNHKKWHDYIENLVNIDYVSDDYDDSDNKCKDLNARIDQQEILHSIKTSKLDTATGCDKVPMRLIRYGMHTLSDALECLFNLIFIIHNQSPLCWKKIDIFPIPKPGRDISLPRNNRPISLICILARIFCKILTFRLLSYLIEYIPFESVNCGFCK